MHQKLVPDSFFILVNNPKESLHARNIFKIRYFERGLSKTLKKLTYIFLCWTLSILMDKVIQNKRGLELVTSHTLGYKITKQVHKNVFISYVLSDLVWWCNIKCFLSYSKNYACKFMQANSWHHKLFHFHLSFRIWKVRKGKEKIQKILISWERKELFKWNKKHFP